MALTISAIRILARSAARRPFQGPVLTFGRQGVIATLPQCESVLREEGLEPHPLPDDMDRGPNVPAFRSGPGAAYTNDQCLFWMLTGQAVQSLDVSDYENADHVADLNFALPEGLEGRFGLVLDGGTLEHVFNVPQALENIKRLLKKDGRIIHLSPMGNWAEHGFFQFSPTLFHDYYVTNGFDFNECLILETAPANLESNFRKRMRAWRWRPERPSAPIVSPDLMTLFFEAEKREELELHVPQQGEAVARVESSRLGSTSGPPGNLSRLRNFIVHKAPMAGSLVLLGKRTLRRDLSSEPWGLDYIGRI